MNRTALNKFNAPEVLGALFGALEAAGLGDTIDQLKKMRVPQMVNDAWMKRPKMAADDTGLTRYLGKKDVLINQTYQAITKITKVGPYSGDAKSIATGLVYLLWRDRARDSDLAPKLFTLFENRGPSLSAGQDVFRLAHGIGQRFGGDQASIKLQLAAFSVALMRRMRMPNLAVLLETLLTTHLQRELAAMPAPGPGIARKTPTQVFDAQAQDQVLQHQAQMAWNYVGKNPEAAQYFAGSVLEDVNWHTLAGKVFNEYTPPDNDKWFRMVSAVSGGYGWGLEPTAAFAYDLLKLAGKNGLALVVKREALRTFPDAYVDED